ncbi:hypothetical protein Tco_0236501 [Tanacetum coccineum]
MVDGLWIDEPRLVKQEFLMHFSNRFSKPDHRRAILHMDFPKTLTSVQQSELECEVSKEEIKRAVWDCGTDKAPGPDGFTFGFYRNFWSLIENDVYKAVMYFFSYGVIPKGCNSSFIALIPKIPGANMVKDFRPISLIGNRQILDGPFILDELIQWCKRKKSQLLLFKVDFEKAFDSHQLESKSKLNGSHRGHMVGSSRAAHKLGCLTFRSAFTYLGSDCRGWGLMSRTMRAWDEVVNRVRLRLSKWKMTMLSIGVLMGTLEALTLASNEKGGREIACRYALNRGFNVNFWGFGRFKTLRIISMALKVIKALYGDSGSVDGDMNSGHTTCWKNIVKEVNLLVDKGIDLRNYICLKTGNGERAQFWEDIVYGLMWTPINLGFPRVYAFGRCAKKFRSASKS